MQVERELKRFVRQIRPGLIGATSNPNYNLAQIIENAKASPQTIEHLRSELQGFLASRDFTTALTETGMTLETGVFVEVFKRVEYKLLPKLHDDSDLLGVISRIFDSQSDANWLEIIDPELLTDFFGLLLPEREKLIEGIAPQLTYALEVLSLRLAGLGYDPLVCQRLRARRDYQNAFMEVTRVVHDLLISKDQKLIATVSEALDRCDLAVKWIRSRRGVEGASLGLTYRLMKIQQVVHRMRLITQVLESVLGEWKPQPCVQLFLEVTLAEIQRFDLGRFVGSNVELLAYQITEHTGKTGEHYITRTRSEWLHMARSAAVGGAVVALLALIKIFVSKLHLPPVPEVLAGGTVYALGFLYINYIGGTLATKQPAMTASTLASALDEAKNSKQAMENLSEVIIRTIRSQMVALLGNYLIAFPTAVLLCLPFFLIDKPVALAGKAWVILDSLHPFLSLSFFYAAVAGVCLFISGLLAGFADNWFVFNHVGKRLKQSQALGNLVGRHNLDRVIQKIDANLGFWVGNVSLGFLLAAMGFLGNMTGLPLDVRHITFSSASFGIAVASLKFQVPLTFLLVIAASVFMMGLINLGVSFTLSLILAVKSRRIRFSQTPQLLKLLAHKFMTRPSEFFVPPRSSS